MCFLYDIINGQLDCPSLVHNLGLNVPTRRVHRVQPPLLHMPIHTTNYGRNSVISRLVSTYNKSFPNIDLFQHSKLTFKNKIIQCLVNKVV